MNPNESWAGTSRVLKIIFPVTAGTDCIESTSPKRAEVIPSIE